MSKKENKKNIDDLKIEETKDIDKIETRRINIRKKKYRKKIVSIILVILFLIIILWGYLYYQTYKTIKTSIGNLKSDAIIFKQVLLEQDFQKAKSVLGKIEEDVRILSDEIQDFVILKTIPQTKNEIEEVQKIMSSVNNLLGTSQRLIDIGSEVYEDLGLKGKSYKDLDFSKLDSNQKGNILVAVRQTIPVLISSNEEVKKISRSADLLSDSPWIKYVNYDIEQKTKLIKDINELLDLTILTMSYLPDFVGYNDPANYLLLLQNNTELRPTGGFIGTYGILGFEDAKLETFFIDDVYNLDKTVKKTMFVEPPWQLQRWNDTSQWSLRDSNWSPDFPTSAIQAQWFYNKESGQDLFFAGAVAITPDFVADLLSITGPIIIDDIEFNKENFVNTLEYRVEVEFKKMGIPLSERKTIIKKLTNELQARLKKISSNKWLELYDIVRTNLSKKHILLFFNDRDLQDIISEKGWAGEIKSSRSDYLMVVDANIGSLKTDLVMDKKIKYKIAKEKIENSENDLIANLEIEYTNNGKFDWNTTRYRTYTRVYVPRDSELIEVQGMMANDRTREIGEVTIEDEFDKTVFGAFISIEPKEVKKLKFKYKLPEYIKKQLFEDKYSLYFQKQPGTKGHKLHIEVEDKILDNDLMVDREFIVKSNNILPKQ